MSDLNEKLKKAKSGWTYLWNLLEKEAVREKISTEALAELFKYQVELYSTKYKLENIENKIKKEKLSKDDKESISDVLSMHITNFQSIAFVIERLLKEG